MLLSVFGVVMETDVPVVKGTPQDLYVATCVGIDARALVTQADVWCGCVLVTMVCCYILRVDIIVRMRKGIEVAISI